MQSERILKIGTRGSALALAQANEVARRLKAAHGAGTLDISIVVISTEGDRSQTSNQPLSEIGGKGLFSKEIEVQLLNSDIDIAVHCAKDMATILPDGLEMPVFLPREDVRDCFISPIAKTIDDLPHGATVGTSSLRRRAQLLRLRPDIKLVEFRGNVDTRLKKLQDGVADATFLAAAGLIRTNQAHQITSFLDTNLFPPAPAQAAIGIELRADDNETRNLITPLNHPETASEVFAERAFLKVLDGSCRTPIAALTRQQGAQLIVYGQILTPDGSEIIEAEISGHAGKAEQLGASLGQRILDLAGPDFMARLKDAL